MADDKPKQDSDEPIVATELEEPKEDPKEEPSKAPEEKAEEAEEPKEEPEEETPEPDEPPMSKRKAERLEKLESLVEKLRGSETPAKPDVKGMDFNTALTADPETVKQLEEDRNTVSQASYQQGLEQAKSIQFHTRLEIDAPRIEAKYPILDKSSDEFNPALANNINQWYLTTVGFNPKTDTVANSQVRYSDFVDGVMEVADQMAGEKNTASAKNIAKQAASTGLRPDGSTAKRMNLNKMPQDMTDEELKAVIGQAGLVA